MSLSDELIGFRIAYLKAIAKSWNDRSFKEKFVSSSGNCTNVLTLDKFKEILLVDNKLANWKMKAAIVKTEHIKGDESYRDGADLMVVKIPVPNNIKGTDLPQAAADYYSEFPTIFGNSNKIDSSNESPMKKVEDVKKMFSPSKFTTLKFLDAVFDDLDDGLGDGGVELMLSFSAVLMNITTKCWSNESYFNYITDIKKIFYIEPLGQPGSTIADGDIRFSNPWGLRINFEKDESAEWEENKGWSNLGHNEIYLHYFDKPSSGKGSDHAQDLMRYNNAGPSYPLTCCA